MESQGLIVEVRNGDINSAIKRLKKMVYKENVLNDYMEHTFYTKRSIRNRLKRSQRKRICQKITKEANTW